MDANLAIAAAIGLLGSIYIFALRHSKTNTPLPPGPKGLPVVGNLLDLPGEGQILWRCWAALKHPVASLTVFGRTLVLLNDLSVSVERFRTGLDSC